LALLIRMGRERCYLVLWAFFRCWMNRPAGLPELVRVAGSRWSVEECFQTAKNETGLDHYQVRKHIAWYRHITLAMVAHAHLAFLTAAPPPGPAAGTSEAEAGLATQGPSRPGRSPLPGVD
jgi:hypothetical protein